MKTKEFRHAIANANTIEELQQIRFHSASSQTSEIKAKIYNIAPGLGWIKYTTSTSTLKKMVGAFNSNCNHIEKVAIKNSRILERFNGKDVFIYVQEKLNGGNGVVIFVREA